MLEQLPEPPVSPSLHWTSATLPSCHLQISLCGEPLRQGLALPFWCSGAFLTLPQWCMIPQRAVCPSPLVTVFTPPRRPLVRSSSTPSPLFIEPLAKPPCTMGVPCAEETHWGDLVIVWPPESRRRLRQLHLSARASRSTLCAGCVAAQAGPRAQFQPMS